MTPAAALMTTPVLLVSTATRWLGTSRAPFALAKAGFEVSMLAPRESLATKSRSLTKVGYLPDNATVDQWIYSFAAMVKGTAPRLVIPCDDMAFRLLSLLLLSPPPTLQPALHMQLAALIEASLGDPEHYRTSVDKVLLPPAAEALGVRVPPYAVVSNVDEAEPFAATHGYPVVLKTSHGFAGQGVATCAHRDELAGAFDRFRGVAAQDLERTPQVRYLLQAHVAGPSVFHSIAAWKGEFLGGWAAEKVVAHPHPTGPGTVGRYHRAPEVRAMVETLVRGLGISGLAGSEFIVEEGTGHAYLLELSRRITPGTHRGRDLGVDLCAALHARLNGVPCDSRSGLDEDEEGIYALFPQEWLRDPTSAWLRNYPVDVPWEEPELIEAMLALRHQG